MRLFKRAKQTQKTVVEPKRSSAEIMAEIHDTFFTEVDRILEEASIVHTIEIDQSLVDKAMRLSNLGFHNSADTLKGRSESLGTIPVQKKNQDNRAVTEAVEYFSFKYPNYKFITEDSVKKICEKYGLIYGSVEHYIGTVPDKNLKQIEDFKIKEEDEVFLKTEHFNGTLMDSSLISYSKVKKEEKAEKENENYRWATSSSYLRRIRRDKLPLEIAALPKDFDLKKMRVVDKKIVSLIDEDPVVLKPVMFKDNKYYLVVTAWGAEASDELVVNQNHN